MPKPIYDFYKAAMRHHNDGDFLYEHNKKYSAGHLFGFVAECGIKAVFLASRGRSTPEDDEDERHLYQHIEVLCKHIAQCQVSARGRFASKYFVMLRNIGDFNDWHVRHRYQHAASIPDSIEKWRDSAKEVMRMLDAAKVDGVIK